MRSLVRNRMVGHPPVNFLLPPRKYRRSGWHCRDNRLCLARLRLRQPLVFVFLLVRKRHPAV